ncbi:hypothetical protein [Butyrivibrio proteoclasticus]|uniref:hypothetical protein n=1 Tax=Butyrivibrio proteoclasticus TaxID=43305 RepID=UPI00047A3D7C|nr:hypothetical protein [Butyrivibrio proteoclasticus]
MASYSFPKDIKVFAITDDRNIERVELLDVSGKSRIAVVVLPNGTLDNIPFERIFMDESAAQDYLDGKEARESKEMFLSILYNNEGGKNG